MSYIDIQMECVMPDKNRKAFLFDRYAGPIEFIGSSLGDNWH